MDNKDSTSNYSTDSTSNYSMETNQLLDFALAAKRARFSAKK